VLSLGLILSSLLSMGDLPIGQVVLSERTLVVSSAMIVIGFQSVLFWVFAKIVAMQRGLLPPDAGFDRVRRSFSLELGVSIGSAVALVGLAADVYAVLSWSQQGFGQLERGSLIGVVCAGSTALTIGFQFIFGSFFMYLLDEAFRPIAVATPPDARAQPLSMSFVSGAERPRNT
jgi:hypothetical protein